MLYYSFFAQSVFEIVLIVRLLRIDLKRPYSIRLKCPDITSYFGALRNQLDNVLRLAACLLSSRFRFAPETIGPAICHLEFAVGR